MQPQINTAIRRAYSASVSRGPDAAAAMCQAAIRRDPEDISMTALLGAVLLKQRRPDEAEKYLRKAIELAPTFAKPHEDLGYLLVESLPEKTRKRHYREKRKAAKVMAQGMEVIHSMYVLTTVASGDIGDIFLRRSSSAMAFFSAPSLMCASSIAF